MGDRLEGGCACGEVRYRLLSDPLFVHCCHCLNCQRQTGSAFVVNILVETDRVELLAGEPQPIDVPRSSVTQRIYRCPTCQIAVYSRYTRATTRFVRAGTLDEYHATPDYARKIVAGRPYKERKDLERAGIPHEVAERIGPPAVIKSVGPSAGMPKGPGK